MGSVDPPADTIGRPPSALTRQASQSSNQKEPGKNEGPELVRAESAAAKGRRVDTQPSTATTIVTGNKGKAFIVGGQYKESIPLFAALSSKVEKEEDEAERRKQVSARLDGLNQFLGQQRKRLLVGNAFLESSSQALSPRLQRKLLSQVIHGGLNSNGRPPHLFQAKLLDKIIMGMLSILGRNLDSRRLLRRQDLLDLLRLQVRKERL